MDEYTKEELAAHNIQTAIYNIETNSNFELDGVLFGDLVYGLVHLYDTKFDEEYLNMMHMENEDKLERLTKDLPKDMKIDTAMQRLEVFEAFAASWASAIAIAMRKVGYRKSISWWILQTKLLNDLVVIESKTVH